MIAGTTTGLVATVVRVVVLLMGGGIVAMVAIDAVVGLTNLVVTSTLARRTLRSLAPAPRDNVELRRRTVRFALVASIGVVITWVVFRRSEIFLLQYFSTPEQIAIYSIPYTAVETLLFLPQAIAFVVGPTLTTLYGAGELGRVREGFARSVRIVVTVMTVLTMYAMLTGPTAVVIFYGSEYEGAGEVLRILLLSAPLVPLWTLTGALLVSLGRQWFATGVIAAAASVTIVLGIVMISAFDAVGAAVSSTIAQAVAVVPLFLYARRAIGGVDLGGFVLGRVVIVSSAAALVAAPALVVLPRVPGFVVATLAYGAAFLVGAAVAPVLTRDDAAALLERVGSRGRGVPKHVLRILTRRASSRPRGAAPGGEGPSLPI